MISIFFEYKCVKIVMDAKNGAKEIKMLDGQKGEVYDEKIQ